MGISNVKIQFYEKITPLQALYFNGLNGVVRISTGGKEVPKWYSHFFRESKAGHASKCLFSMAPCTLSELPLVEREYHLVLPYILI